MVPDRDPFSAPFPFALSDDELTEETMKRSAILLLTLFALATVAGARERKPKLPIRDEARLAAVKRVAVFAIYGPKEIDGGFGKNFEAQQLYDRAETNLLDALKARGMEVLPLDTTRALLEADYAAAYLQHVPPRQRKHLEAPQSRPALDRGYLLALPEPVASANTRLVFGSDYGWKTFQSHQTGKKGGDRDSFDQPPAKHEEAMRKALAELAAKAGADAYVVMRVVPTIATTVAKEQSHWNPLGGITKGISAIKAMKEGDHGFAAIDVVMADTRGEIVYQDQIIGMSKETSGTGGGFNLKMKPEEIEKLTKDALAEAVPLLTASIEGR